MIFKRLYIAYSHKKYRDMYGVDNDDLGGVYKATKCLISQGQKLDILEYQTHTH